MKIPSMTEALNLFDEGLKMLSINHPKFPPSIINTYRVHGTLVAFCAEIIASKIPELDGRSAYILGLLHDYGKFIIAEEKGDAFHGISGYEAFLEKGYDDLARICLTHSFPNKKFKIRDYSSYPVKELCKARRLLRKIEYNDYDRLIQLSDMFVAGLGLVNLKDRMNFIRDKYRISTLIIKRKYRDALILKHYFDEKCGCDIYKLLGVDE